MALTNCPECGKEISDKSIHCIHCGYPLNIVNTKPNVSYIKMVDEKCNNMSKIEILNGTASVFSYKKETELNKKEYLKFTIKRTEDKYIFNIGNEDSYILHKNFLYKEDELEFIGEIEENTKTFEGALITPSYKYEFRTDGTFIKYPVDNISSGCEGKYQIENDIVKTVDTEVSFWLIRLYKIVSSNFYIDDDMYEKLYNSFE